MDSMRHLSTSLPYSSRRRNEADLLSSFKAAALSVTQLYKAAATGNTQAREAGYQDALEDLLAYMDTEKIGLNDGEGWNIRRWLLQRIEDTPAGKAPASEDGEESQREDGDARASSPELRKTSAELEDTAQENPDEQQPASLSTQAQPGPTAIPPVPSSKDFTFRSTTQYPTNHDREGNMEIDHSTSAMPSAPRASAKTSSKSRSNHHGRREGRPQHTSVLNLNLGPAAGSKRRIPYSDFFDISGVTLDTPERRDNGSRGGKRARQT